TTLSARSLEERVQRTDSSAASSTGARTGRGGSAAAADVSRTVDGVRERSSRSLLGRIGSGLLITASLSLSQPISAAAQEQAAELPAPPPRPTVLIPTKPDGTPAGDKVYISQSFFDELF